MAILRLYLSMITLNMNGLNSLIKTILNGLKAHTHKIQQYATYKRLPLALKIHIDWEWRDTKRHLFQGNGNQKRKKI